MSGALRNDIGAPITVTTSGVGGIASAAYATITDVLTIDNTTNKALVVDFTLYPAAFGTAPVAGAISLVAVDWSLDATPVQGPAPTASLPGRFVGSFDPKPGTGNANTRWRMSLPTVALGRKVDFYLFNNGTGQSLAVGAVLIAQCWSPG